MTHSAVIKEERPQPNSRMPSSSHLTESLQTDASASSTECRTQEQVKEIPRPGKLPEHIPSSSGSAAHTGESEELVITCIRAIDVALGLRRLPAGFYTVVHHSGHEWKTESKPSSVNDDVIEWEGPIPIPSDLSATICFEVYASYEFEPMLGSGEQLRKFTFIVEQLLQNSTRAIPLTFVQKGGEVVSPCSSIYVTVNRQKCDDSDSSASRTLNPNCSTSESRRELEDATNLGHLSLTRYREQGRIQDLEHSVEEFERALSICSPDHPCRAVVQSNLATAKSILCQVENTDKFLEDSLTLYRDALAARPVGHLDRPSTLIQLAMVHFARFEKRRDEADAAWAEDLLHEAMELSCAESHEKRVAILMLQVHARRRVGPVEQDCRSSLDLPSHLTDQDLWDLSDHLLCHFKRYGGIADLQQAIIILEQLVARTPVWDDRYPGGLATLGVALRYRFQHLGEPMDLEEAITRQRNAIEFVPHSHPIKSAHLSSLGNSLMIRFQRFGELADLEDAISRHRLALDLTPRDHPEKKSGNLHNLGNSLFLRFQRVGKTSDLEEAILMLRDAVELVPRIHPDAPARHYNLGNFLQARFECLGKLSDLDEAISMLRDAVDLARPGHPNKPAFFSCLGSSFKARYTCLGELSDLEEAISRHSDAVDLASDHPHKSICLNNLANSLMARYQCMGELSDLEDAISRNRDAVNLTPQGHPDMHNLLNSLGGSFTARFLRLGELTDLEDAILMLRNTVDHTPDNHPDKPTRLNNLGNSLKYRFRHLGEPSDLEDAISMLRDAVYLTPPFHPDKPTYLNSLGNSFKLRFEHLGEPSDLEYAISSLMDAVNLTPSGHPNRRTWLNNLGSSLFARFGCYEELYDLEAAISRFRDAVDLTPHSHLDKPGYLCNLGNSFAARFACLREPNDLEQAISLYSRAACASIGPISSRFSASQRWILCARHIGHRSLLHAYSVAIALLPQLAWIGLSLKHRYDGLKQSADVVLEAAAAALDSGLPEIAVEWLEQGRSIVWGELYQLRSSYEELSSAHPGYACRLRELSAALEHASATREKSFSTLLEETPRGVHPTKESLDTYSSRHRALAIARDKVLGEIRGLPGLEKFLLHREFSQLRALAHSGPIVILNAAKNRCDALVILADVDHVIHVPLPNFSLRRAVGLQNLLERLLGHARTIHHDIRKGDPALTRGGVSWESLLSTLWNGVVKPVLDALAFSVCVAISYLNSWKSIRRYVFEQIPGDLSRVFWCPTGPFTFLPIHAAGIYDNQHTQPGNKVYDFVVSSYIPTLSTLALSPKSSTTLSDNFRLLSVCQPLSDGLPRLPGANTELEHIRTVFKNLPSTHTTLLESSVGTVEEVLIRMKGADWVHFACHGIQDGTDPANSGLCLADRRRLKLRDIIRLSRTRGGLAFLSACQTAMGDEHLSDEAIHIAAGMLFAGYGGVIGTMWSISDRLAPDVARGVYEQLFRNGAMPDYREAARALHDAIGRIRDSNVSFVEWLPFIHVGL